MRLALRVGWVGASLALTLGSGAAFAQTAVQQVEARRDADRSKSPGPLTSVGVPFTSQRPPSNADDIRFTLTSLALVGATAFEPAEISALYAGDLGREITLTRLFEIAGAVQTFYRDADFIFTRVLVPAQEIVNGVVRIEVIEARIDGLVVEEPADPVGPVRRLAERMVSALVGVDNPTGAQIERAVLNVNALPGIARATVVPQPSGPESRGGLILHLNVERDPFEGVLYADNRQTPAIGRSVVGATVTMNSYSPWADTTSLSIFNSFDVFSDTVPETGETDGAGYFDERTTFYAVHQRAVGRDGAMLKASGLYSRTLPGDDLSVVAIDGDQYFGSLELSQPFIRSRRLGVGGAVVFEYLDSGTDISNGLFRITDDRIRVAAARVDGLYRDAFGYTTFETQVRQGLDILDATPADQPERSRFDGQSVFTLVRGEAERLVLLGDDFSAWARLGAQYSFDPLLSSEEFSIGGLTYGRGYDPSEFTGDHGFGLAAELRHSWRLNVEGFAFSAEGYGFLDYGVVWNAGEGEPARRDIVSTGGGVRLFLPENAFVGAEIAIPVGRPLTRVDEDGEQIDGPRFFLTLSKRF